jgi:tetratricopeptide (TPR) repeat protein
MVAPNKIPNQDIVRFLSHGTLGNFTLEEIASACDQYVRAQTQTDAKTAVISGQKFVRQARRHGGDIYITALRSHGWAALVAGKYHDAEKSYLEARKLLHKDPLACARIDRVLIDIYMYQADFNEARRRAAAAMKTFRRLKESADIARTEVNYANLLHRQDRHQEAQRYYHRAATYFEKAGPPTATALCYYNEANTQVQLLQFEKAEETYRRARDIFEQNNQQLHATGCLYGLSWLHMLEGNYHVALQELAECEKRYREGGQERELILCLLDQAEVYLILNLVLYARQAAEKAGRGASRLGIAYEKAKADFFIGLASMRMGHKSEAIRALLVARAGFKKERNEGFLAAVSMTLAQINNRRRPRIKSFLESRARFRKAQLPLWEAICDLQILAYWPDNAPALQRLSRNKATGIIPHLAARRFAALGDRAANQGSPRLAVTNWTKAAEILDSVRAKLPPIEMRTSFLDQHIDPFEKLIASEYNRDPLTGALWSERLRTAGLWSAADTAFMVASPERKAAEESLSTLARQVAAISQETVGTPTTRSTANIGIEPRLRRLQTDVHKAMIRSNSYKQNGTDDDAWLKNKINIVSQNQPLIQFHVGPKDIYAFVHYNGETASYCYLDGSSIARRLAAEWRFLVERFPMMPETASDRNLTDEKQILKRIGQWLLPPLQIPSGISNLLIIPDGLLSNLPWMALSDNSHPLLDKYSITLSPSIRHYLQASENISHSDRIRIFVGETSGLPFIEDELTAVRSIMKNRNVSYHIPCRRRDWPDGEDARIWHFSGHAQLRSDNPFYSALIFEDGPLFAADLRLRQNKVELVMLAACRTGQHTARQGEETGGLVRSFLETGTRNVIASHWAVSDRSAGIWTEEMYRNYLNGSSAADAVRMAAMKIRERFPSAYHWSAFSVFGTGK